MLNDRRSCLLLLLAMAACGPSVSAPDPTPALPPPVDLGSKPTTPPPPPPEVQAPYEDPAPIAATEAHAFSVLDLLGMDRLTEPRVSPDGETVVFVRRMTDMVADQGRTDLWSVPTRGGAPTRLTQTAENESSPRWSNDGTTIYFLAKREDSSQVWSIPAAGGAANAVTNLPLDVGHLEVTPNGVLLVTLEVFIDCEDLACTAKRLEERNQSPATGQHYETLFVRHWDTYADGRRSHLFAIAEPGATPVDLTAGMDADVPSKPFGGSEEFDVSPDGRTVVFSARDAGRTEAWSTNFDLFAVPIEGGPRRLLTESNPGWDNLPVFSPDGRTLAWAAMAHAGYESDRMVVHTMAWPPEEKATPRALTSAWDRSVSELAFAAIRPSGAEGPDGNRLIAIAENLGQRSIFTIDVGTGSVQELLHEGTHESLAVTREFVVALRHDLQHPAELVRAPIGGGSAVAITTTNETKIAAAHMGRSEAFSFVGALGDEVHGYLVEPADYDPQRRYPVALLIHGGPQGSFGNAFGYRWNPQTYAGAGIAVVMIDFHGSTGYGQAFTDSIRGDWGGKPLDDLKAGLAFVLERYPWLDGDRVCALGASYGGYMINWIASQWPDRFRCLVNHDGVFEQRMMYFGTEELWFPEWEHGGPYYEAAPGYERHNPALFVDRWSTPMLVIHGGLDFRVPPTQGLGAFAALQRRGIPSELLFFPNENHWVLKPNNSKQWHDTVGRWLDRYLRG